jgi:hypothetical protein
MPAGIARSVFTRKIADTLGWKIHRVREYWNRLGYEAPYTDLNRGLRLLHEGGTDISKCLKAFNLQLDEIGLTAQPSPPPQALILTPSPAAAAPHPTSTALIESQPPDMSLLARLARATPGGDTPENRHAIRGTLKQHDFDLRSRDETRAQLILAQAGIKIENFESRDPVALAESERLPDLDQLSNPELKQIVKDLCAALSERDMTIQVLTLRHSKMMGMLDVGKARLFKAIRAGRDDVTPTELAAMEARGVGKEGLGALEES